MSRVRFTQAVNYPPWIGSSYGSRGELRILIVGRSYFDARYKDKTIEDFISEHIKNRMNDPFYTALELVLSEKSHWKSGLGGLKLDRKKFWNSVCYHQFIQGILRDGYTPPDRGMWKEGQDIYKEVLLSLQPEIIIMAGTEVFNHMPTLKGHHGPVYSAGGTEMKTWILEIGSEDCWIAGIDNPRDSSFRTDVWKELYHQFLADYRNKHRLTSFSSL